MADINNYESLLAGDSPAAKLLRNITNYRYNPASIQSLIVNYTQDMLNGRVSLVDPTNPVVFTMEASACTTAAAVIENAANTRRLYPALAQTPEDLYIHMSDKDFIGRFATPAVTKLSLLLNKAEVYSKIDAISASNPGFSRKLRIPRDSEIIVDNKYAFTLTHGVDIQKRAHGELEITLDTDRTTPLNELQTNVLHWETRVDANKVEYLYIEIPVMQYKATLMQGPVTASTGYSERFTFGDEFFFARVFYQSGGANAPWTEMKTTHTDQVYDITTPTAVLKVIDGILSVYVPQVYTNTGVVSGSIKTIIYTTKGVVNVDFSNYKQGAVVGDWRSINPTESSVDEQLGAGGFIGLQTKALYIANRVTGGSNALSFEKLRERVIYNAIGPQNIPITNVQVQTALETKGYDIVKNIDIVTNRVFLASRTMPQPTQEKLVTAVASTIGTFITTLDEFYDNSSFDYGAYRHPGYKRITLKPEMHYRTDNGQVYMCTESEMSVLTDNSVSTEDKAVFINQRKYLFTPFHYVLDYSEDEFKVRPYYLNNPQAVSVRFIGDNDSRGFQVAIDKYKLERYKNSITGIEGWRLTIDTKSSEEYKKIGKPPASSTDRDLSTFTAAAQLSFIPSNETQRVFLLHTDIEDLDTGERRFIFDMPSTMDIGADDELYMTGWKSTNIEGLIKTKLLGIFDVLFVTDVRPADGIDIPMDDLVYSNLAIEHRPYALTHQSITLSFGKALPNLWSRSRSTFKGSMWATYTQDIPDTYAEDVYEIDPTTGTIFSFDASGNVVYNKLHNAGDTVFEADGVTPVIKHRKGSVILGPDGKPTPVPDTSGINRHIDIFFLEGVYRYANDWAAESYRLDVVSSVVKWITEDLADIEKNLLEQTRMYFYPKANIGYVRAMVGDGSVVNIMASQRFAVDLYVNKQVYSNDPLRIKLTRSTIETIDLALKQGSISISDLITNLRQVYGEDVISVKVTGLGGADDYQALTILSESERLSIRKDLRVTQDNTLLVTEAVEVSFIRHEIVNANA